jgi:hypothetical protein
MVLNLPCPKNLTMPPLEHLIEEPTIAESAPSVALIIAQTNELSNEVPMRHLPLADLSDDFPALHICGMI